MTLTCSDANVAPNLACCVRNRTPNGVSVPSHPAHARPQFEWRRTFFHRHQSLLFIWHYAHLLQICVCNFAFQFCRYTNFVRPAIGVLNHLPHCETLSERLITSYSGRGDSRGRGRSFMCEMCEEGLSDICSTARASLVTRCSHSEAQLALAEAGIRVTSVLTSGEPVLGIPRTLNESSFRSKNALAPFWDARTCPCASSCAKNTCWMRPAMRVGLPRG